MRKPTDKGKPAVPGRENPSRTMTLYDRLEDARARREIALASKPTAEPDGTIAAPEPRRTSKATPDTRLPAAPDFPAEGRRRRTGLLLWLLSALLVAGGGLLFYSSTLPGGGRVSVTEPEPAPDVVVNPEPNAAAQPAPSTNRSSPAETAASAPVADGDPAQPVPPTLTVAPEMPTAPVPVAILWRPLPLAPAAPDRSDFALDLADPGTRTVPPQAIGRTPPPRPTEPAIASDAEADIEAASSEPEVPFEPSPAGRFDVVLHYPNRVAPEAAEALAASAARAGFVIETLRPAAFSISRTNVRFFHPEDADAAARLAGAVGGELRDFTDFRPPPAQGVIEIYMEGSGAGASSQNRSSGGLAADLQRLETGIRNAIRRIGSGN